MIKALIKRKAKGGYRGLFKSSGSKVYEYSYIEGKLLTDCKDRELIKELKNRLK
jgi:hypothetical protein